MCQSIVRRPCLGLLFETEHPGRLCGHQRREGWTGDLILLTQGRNIPNLYGIQTPLTSRRILTRFWENSGSELTRCTSYSESWLCSGYHPSPADLRFNGTRRANRKNPRFHSKLLLCTTKYPQQVGPIPRINTHHANPRRITRFSVRACNGLPLPTPSTWERYIKFQGQSLVPGL